MAVRFTTHRHSIHYLKIIMPEMVGQCLEELPVIVLSTIIRPMDMVVPFAMPMSQWTQHSRIMQHMLVMILIM